MFTIWSFDSGSLGNRVSDWFANGIEVFSDYSFGGANLPFDDTQQASLDARIALADL